jgi:hypothetical protein
MPAARPGSGSGGGTKKPSSSKNPSLYNDMSQRRAKARAATKPGKPGGVPAKNTGGASRPKSSITITGVNPYAAKRVFSGNSGTAKSAVAKRTGGAMAAAKKKKK